MRSDGIMHIQKWNMDIDIYNIDIRYNINIFTLAQIENFT